ncbi:MAG: hypothetical protein ACLSHC_05050 [Bilophila wadsworthia]
MWGKYRRNAEAAKAALQGAHAGYELALVTLSADVAQQYFSYRMTENSWKSHGATAWRRRNPYA